MGDSGIVITMIVGILILGILGLSQEVFAVTNINSCQILNIPNETYVLTSDITLFAPQLCFNIAADGITLDGNGHTITGAGGTGVLIAGRDNVTVENLTLKHFTQGMFYTFGHSSLIKNNIVDSAFEGIRLTGNANDNILENNIITNTNGNGIAIANSEGNVVRENSVIFNSGTGIGVGSSEDNFFVNNIIENNLQNGIGMTNSEENTIEQNEINNNGCGVCFAGGSNNKIINNNINENNLGIGFSGSDHLIENNRINKNGAGIGIGGDNHVIKFNEVNKNNDFGVGVLGNANVIENNVFNKNGGVGLGLSGGDNHIVRKNTANNNQFEGINLNSSDNNFLEGNTATHNQGGGIFLFDSKGNSLNGNIANENDLDGFFIIAQDNTLENNEASNNGGFGFNDDSTDSGTAGTANLYINNICLSNASGGSDPAGLCNSAPPNSPPEITAPDDITVECNEFGGASSVDLGEPTVTDPDENDLPPTNDAVEPFALRDTTVTWSVEDSDGASDSDTQTVTVEDTTAPDITVPDGFMAIANTDGGWSGDIGQATATDVCSDVEIDNDAPDVFPLGDTPVTWCATDGEGNEDCDEQTINVKPLPVEIDIKPGSDPNAIQPFKMGVTPVVILSSNTFSAETVDFSTVTFGPNDATPFHKKPHFEDVNKDGLDDMVLHFKTKEIGIEQNTTELCLKAKTLDDIPIEGCDSIVVVPKK